MRPPPKCIQNDLIQDIFFRKHWFLFGQNKQARTDDANNGGFDKERG